MQRKFIVRQIYTLLSTVLSVCVLSFVICSEITIFHFVLYQRRKYITVDTIITQNLIPKLIFGTVLSVLGIFCYVFYLSVLRENMLLIVVRFLFYSAGLISCLWEYETLFYISSSARIMWIKCGDILFLLLNYTFMELLKSESRLFHLNRIFRYFQAGTIGFVGIMLVSSTKTNLYLGAVYTAILWVLCIIYMIKMTRTREKFIYAAFSFAYFFITYLYFGMRTSDNLLRDQQKLLFLAYFILVSAVLVYLYYYRKFHLRMSLSKDVNQKIKFANRYKYEITNKLIEAVENPINLIEGLNEILEEIDSQGKPNADNILESMNYEISRIKKSLKYLKNNSLLVENTYNMEMVKVSFHLIIKEVMEGIEGKRQYAGRCVFVNRLSQDTLISCDPYYLSDAFINILQELLAVGMVDQQVLIAARNGEDSSIQIEMRVNYRPEERQRIRQFCHLFKSKVFQQNTFNEENIFLISAINIVLLQEGMFSVTKDNKLLTVRCRFPQSCKEERKKNFAGAVRNGKDAFADAAEEQMIVLISNKAEQIALISSYLLMEPFRLQVFSDGIEAVDYLNKTPNVVLVLIGDVFLGMTYFEISKEIRKNFSLAQLSVVLISSKKAHYMNDKKLSAFNDILEETFSRHQFLLKVYSAVRLRQSEEELSKYRIDFLQSQMNPHFIFNTISTIMPLCLNRPMEAYSLLEYFAEYLRGNLYAGNLHSQIELHREVDLIDAFLNIEKVRFKGEIESLIFIACDENTPILPLLIEPLVENCVVHARIPGEVLHIEVRITREDSGLFVVVKDDGTGIGEELIKEIYQMNNSNSFGLTNVIKRLRLYYQEELLILSEGGRGTEISFHIPNRQK